VSATLQPQARCGRFPHARPLLLFELQVGRPRGGDSSLVREVGVPGVTGHKTSLRAEEVASDNDRASMSPGRKQPKSNHMTLGHAQCSVRCAPGSPASFRAHGARYEGEDRCTPVCIFSGSSENPPPEALLTLAAQRQPLACWSGGSPRLPDHCACLSTAFQLQRNGDLSRFSTK
jgi:hypothetical protein